MQLLFRILEFFGKDATQIQFDVLKKTLARVLEYLQRHKLSENDRLKIN